jgi:hypothetical protein
MIVWTGAQGPVVLEISDVRFTSESGHARWRHIRPLCAISGHGIPRQTMGSERCLSDKMWLFLGSSRPKFGCMECWR